ncbi:MAG: D-glycero-beta-D-manno-heptose-7-phosphate kinase [Elusimicrobiota bacterium]
MQHNIKLNKKRLLDWVEKFKGVPVLVLGDLMMDRSYRGTSERISPEAPVPVVHVKSSDFTPGGSGNVVSNLASLGAYPSLIAVRGNDQDGYELELDLKSRGINVRGLIIDSSRPTITKTRVFVGHQQVSRFDFENRENLSSQFIRQLFERVKQMIPAHKAVVISDYGKGLISKSLIQLVLREAHKNKISVLVDPKIEHFMQYKGVDCITPNTKEAIEGMKVLSPKNEKEFLSLGWKISKTLKCASVLITRGEKGMTLFKKGEEPFSIPAYSQQVFDVTGAGDTVISTFALARAIQAPHIEAAQLSNIAASLVVAKVGTAVVTQSELKERIHAL